MGILVITTGGTIGAVACSEIQKPDRIQIMPPQGVDRVADSLEKDFAHIPTRRIPFEHRDSNHIDEAYRAKLVQLVEGEAEKQILITHGTDTLLQTAEYVFRQGQGNPHVKDKVILFTGAMIPLANGAASDGYMNLDFALEQLAHGNLAPGVYVVLSDYQDAENRQGWSPRLYPFAPGRYEKYYDPEDGSRSRLR